MGRDPLPQWVVATEKDQDGPRRQEAHVLQCKQAVSARLPHTQDTGIHSVREPVSRPSTPALCAPYLGANRMSA